MARRPYDGTGSRRRRQPSRGNVQDQRVTLTAATTEGRDTHAAAAALQLVREVQGNAGTAGADRVAERDGTAVGVDLLGIDAEGRRRRDAHSGERLVELEQVDVGDLQALLRKRS